MAVFNVSFLNPAARKKTGGSGAGILADQLSILENELGKDGYLSPGDYDLLVNKARELQGSPGLTASQRSDYDVKISRFEKGKQVSNIDRTEDIERINRILKSEAAEDVMMVGNNPIEFIRGRAASVQAKINDLSEMIERRTGAGMDTTEYYNEYQAALAEYNERLNALGAMEGFDGSNPVLGHVAFVTTNTQGEIVDVEYGRHGSRSGYAETNSMIDGFQVYGRINFKREGKNFFVLGQNVFSAPDMMIPDPAVPGSFKPNKLVADLEQKGPYTVGQAGYFNIPGSELKIQSYVPRNSWAKGVSGTIYKRREDGGYSRYMNVRESMPEMPNPEWMLTLPAAYEQSLMRNVDETIDVSAPIMPDEGMMTPWPGPQEEGLSQAPDQLPMTPLPAAPMTPAPQPQAAATTKTPKQSRVQASEGVGSTIQRTVKSGVDFVKGLFNR